MWPTAFFKEGMSFKADDTIQGKYINSQMEVVNMTHLPRRIFSVTTNLITLTLSLNLHNFNAIQHL